MAHPCSDRRCLAWFFLCPVGLGLISRPFRPTATWYMGKRARLWSSPEVITHFSTRSILGPPTDTDDTLSYYAKPGPQPPLCLPGTRNDLRSSGFEAVSRPPWGRDGRRTALWYVVIPFHRFFARIPFALVERSCHPAPHLPALVSPRWTFVAVLCSPVQPQGAGPY